MASPSSHGSGAGAPEGQASLLHHWKGQAFKFPFLPPSLSSSGPVDALQIKVFPETLPGLKGSWPWCQEALPLSPAAWTASH